MEKLSLDQIIAQSLESFKNCPDHDDCENCEEHTCVSIVAVADFPSNFGTFQLIGFINNKDKEEHIAIVKGDIVDEEAVLTRVHSSCLTGDALGSLRCDCGSQLETALSMIEEEGVGVIIYMQQEGRGIGLLNKLRAYALQDSGYDTYDANVALGFDADQRDYEVAGEMLRTLGVKSVRLITNNPEKIKQLQEYIQITERVPLELKPSEYSVKYMETKKNRFGHFLSLFKPFKDKNGNL
ncbi:MAG: GTP cyclohydrolase II [Candidatus Hodarchaeales archaeon]|jgi:GTP cyclohydrolase II